MDENGWSSTESSGFIKAEIFSSVEIPINIKTFPHTRITKYDKVYGYMI